MERNRIRDFGIVPGRLETGKRNKITDVPGVKVGHCTVKTEENHTGITVIVPGADNTTYLFVRRRVLQRSSSRSSCSLLAVIS